MNIRTKTPSSSNKYYLIESAGGWSPCILGNNPPYKGSVLNNCVGYGVSRFNELGGYNKIKYIGNRYPRAMIARAKEQGLKVQQKPAPGGLMVWAGTKEHCCICEKFKNGKARTSESGWNSKSGVYNKTRSGENWGQSGKYKYMGCILNPAIDPYEIPEIDCIKYGMEGEGVKWLQWALIKSGSSIELDGKFGPKTREAVYDFQYKNGLKVDGLAGPKTQAVIKEKFCIL